MRIVQISDIHLSKENLTDLKEYYIEALIKDLQVFNEEKSIDLIIMTGDLIDKGGESFGDNNPYYIFRDEVIHKIISKLKVSSQQVLIIPGNHDVEQKTIREEFEFFLSSKLTTELANERSQLFAEEFNEDNKRIQRFKEFEKEFHADTINNINLNIKYNYSNNESVVIYDKDGKKFGVVLINDSWRCSSTLKKEEHFIGFRQLLRAQNKFKDNATNMNIAVFHHPLNAINDDEKDEISAILKSKDFDIAIFGHSHRHEAVQLSSSNGGYLSVNGRSAFSEPKELSSKYQPGYNVLDIDAESRKYTLHARKFIRARYEFDRDTDSLPNGIESKVLPQKVKLYHLAENSNNEDKELPGSYTADVDKIVSLLIGESIYPDKYAFVRELIQNSVDACNRVKEKYSQREPKIIMTIDALGNYIEVSDEGDGMSKNVLKNHFAVLGKSISQEHNDNVGRSNLISKFGIGFISTFIAAEKVLINTRSEEDGQIMFEIDSVFEAFKYVQPTTADLKETTGTTVRVYLKKAFHPMVAYNIVKSYCRHIENFEINLDNSINKIEEKWNVENSHIRYETKTSNYELKLAFGNAGNGIIASYCGFLINRNPYQIIPDMFPVHICGEINFVPKSIDFDISRTNIIPTAKAETVRKEISVSLRKLFRDVLETKALNMYDNVINYLQCYLQHYDSIISKIEKTYSDFYSKRELISLCAEHTLIQYDKKESSIATVLNILRSKSIDKIYVQYNSMLTDYEAIVVDYLANKGNLIVQHKSTFVNFITTPQHTTNLIDVIKIIANEYAISIHDIRNVTPDLLTEMRLDKSGFNEKLLFQLSNIESTYNVKIEIGKFSKSKKSSVSYGNQIFLNFNHDTFQSILGDIENIEETTLRIYLLGILGLQLSN